MSHLMWVYTVCTVVFKFSILYSLEKTFFFFLVKFCSLEYCHAFSALKVNGHLSYHVVRSLLLLHGRFLQLL